MQQYSEGSGIQDLIVYSLWIDDYPKLVWIFENAILLENKREKYWSSVEILMIYGFYVGHVEPLS